jgi:hypothetical protein
MTTTIASRLGAPDASARLRAALDAGAAPCPDQVEALVERCGVEPDFFVRDMLTWALTRHPADLVVPRLIDEIATGTLQGRAQALHTLSKVGDRRAWPAVSTAVTVSTDPGVAAAGWRAAVALVPDDGRAALAEELVRRLGSGDQDLRRSLSRALVALGEQARPLLAAVRAPREALAHAAATLRLLDEPDTDFAHAVAEAERVVLLRDAPTPVQEEEPA